MKTREFSYWPIDIDALSATDLRAQVAALAAGEAYELYGIAIDDHAESAQALYLPSVERLGIAWGADATWAEVPDIETGIAWYVNDGTEWEAHN